MSLVGAAQQAGALPGGSTAPLKLCEWREPATAIRLQHAARLRPEFLTASRFRFETHHKVMETILPRSGPTLKT